MKQLTKIFGDAIVGVSNGFDRLVFQGMVRPIMYPEGAMSFFRRRRILFKDADKWVREQTRRLVSAVEDWSKRECGESIRDQCGPAGAEHIGQRRKVLEFVPFLERGQVPDLNKVAIQARQSSAREDLAEEERASAFVVAIGESPF